jgi:uncharacterized RmlC-like cupin family protein
MEKKDTLVGAVMLIIGFLAHPDAKASIQNHHHRKGCILVQTTVPGWAHMPYSYSLLFCAPGITDTVLSCPTGVPEMPLYPAEVMYCTITARYPHGFPSYLRPPAPGGY